MSDIEPTMRYVKYRRKSSERDEKQFLSIESQKRLLNKKFPDLKVVLDIEESKTAFKPYVRPKFYQMIDMIKNGKADGILAWHPHRLSRNEIDAATITYLVRTGVIKSLKFSDYNFDNSPEGIMMLQLALSQSQYSSSKLSKDVKVGLETKARNGWLPSGAKAGYTNIGVEKGNKKIANDKKRFPLIKKTWELMLSGSYSPPQILEKLNNEWGYRTPKHKRIGGNPMTRSAIYKMFADPFYYGKFEYPVGSGNWYKGKHEPMITREEFNRVQVLLGRKGRRRFSKHNFPLTGCMKCGECDASITAHEKWQVICTSCKTKFHKGAETDSCQKCNTLIENMNDPTILYYNYYHCTKRKKPDCTQGAIEVSKLEPQIDRLLSEIQISEKFKDWAIKYLNELNESETEDRNSVQTSLQDAYGDCVKRIDNLVKLKISPQNSGNELLTDEEFKAQKESLMTEKKELKEQLDSSDKRIDEWVELSEKTFEFACYARYWFENGDPDRKRQIFRDLGSNLILKDKIVHINLEKPLEWIDKIKREEETISPRFEPEKNGYSREQLEDYWSQNPTLLPLLDSNNQPWR